MKYFLLLSLSLLAIAATAAPVRAVEVEQSDFIPFEPSDDDGNAGLFEDLASPRDHIDIAFIGERFSGAKGMKQFHSDSKAFQEHLLTFEPFRSYAGVFRFHDVENEDLLGCSYSGRLVRCDNALAKRKIRAAKVPFDKLVVIVNSSVYGGSGGDISVSFNGARSEKVFVHEFGHSFGGLTDEYISHDGQGSQDNRVHANCFAGIPAAREWNPLVRLADYRLGCAYSNWYRSSPGSIMLSLNFNFFNPVSQLILRNAIEGRLSGRIGN